MLYAALIGLVAGALAKFFMPGDEPGNFDNLKGVLITMLIGVLGGFVGGIINSIIPLFRENIVGDIVLGTIGAIILLFAYKRFKDNE